MESEAVKFIGVGLATIGMAGAGIGVGTIFGNFLQGALRNPSAAGGQIGNLFVGAALAEALGIPGAALALTGVVALTALEFLVAFLQAFVFAVLTTIYLNDVVNIGHH